MRRIYSASREAARRLIAAGCRLDDTSNLPRTAQPRSTNIRISRPSAYAFAKAISMTGRVIYVIPICIATERQGGVVIESWQFSSPWGHHISFDYDPRDVLPRSELATHDYLINSPLLEVFNNRQPLRRGKKVEGVLCGVASFQEIPAESEAAPMPSAELYVDDEYGMRTNVKIPLSVERIVEANRVHGPRRDITGGNVLEPFRSTTHEADRTKEESEVEPLRRAAGAR